MRVISTKDLSMTLSPKARAKQAAGDVERQLHRIVTPDRIEQVPVSSLKPYARNARTHSAKQIAQIAASMRAFGFVNPVLVTAESEIIAGHGRVEAAKQLGMHEVPVLRIEGLTQAQIAAYRLADNRLAELAGWDADILAIEFQALSNLDIGFELSVTGWDMPEIDLLLDPPACEAASAPDPDDIVPPLAAVAVSRVGDLWQLGRHRVVSGSALDPEVYARLLNGEQVRMVCQDPPWNIAVSTISGMGKIQHREFPMGSGEMSDAEFRTFLTDTIRQAAAHCVEGAILELFIDWRGVEKMIAAGESLGLRLVNVCVWAKTNAGMGSLFRSQHELVVVFTKPGAPFRNNVQLGKFGRYRTNVWTMAGQNSFGADRMAALESHPTAKPVALIAEALRDVTDRGDLVLDSFLGSGTTLLAAERTGRVARCIELDPLYVDTAIRRWEASTGESAVLEATGQTFEQVSAERASADDKVPDRDKVSLDPAPGRTASPDIRAGKQPIRVRTRSAAAAAMKETANG
jgi:DNA modification methylase